MNNFRIIGYLYKPIFELECEKTRIYFSYEEGVQLSEKDSKKVKEIRTALTDYYNLCWHMDHNERVNDFFNT